MDYARFIDDTVDYVLNQLLDEIAAAPSSPSRRIPPQRTGRISFWCSASSTAAAPRRARASHAGLSFPSVGLRKRVLNTAGVSRPRS